MYIYQNLTFIIYFHMNTILRDTPIVSESYTLNKELHYIPKNKIKIKVNK